MAHSASTRIAALALIDAGHTVSDAARLMDLPDNTVRNWANADADGSGSGVFPDRAEVRLRLAHMYDAIAARALRTLWERFDELPLGKLMVQSAIAVDKSIVLRGEASKVIRHAGLSSLTDEQLKQLIDGRGEDSPPVLPDVSAD
jgi:hypothetical protein